MIVRNIDWSLDEIGFNTGWCRDVDVDANPTTRVSQLLGANGEPLEIESTRQKFGFDLTPR